ncbi:MAG TPA: penicillin-binding protein 1C [Flavisolibacter sp.]|nr:penicillin-binding protein 1C [Flavisolibacter sp.]
MLVKRFVIVALSFFIAFLALNLLFPLPDKIDYSTIITASDGQVVNAFLTKDEKWRMKTELNEISPVLRRTIIAKEDKYFYHHPGVNFFALGRAAAMNILHLRRTSGASTITMQVARALEPRKRNIFSKLAEMFRAFQLEWKYSKDEILQLYLNLVPYGGNIEGVKAASLLYFKKNPDHLSLSEVTALSIIPNRPSSLVIGRSNDLIIKERNRWLRKFADEGVFTRKEIQDALSEPLSGHRTSVPHFIPHLSYKLRSGAHATTIPTNIVLNTQLKIEKLTEDYVRALKLKNIRNAAVVVIDNRSHKVISYLGSAGFADTTDGGQVNGAAAIRQPGSTLKPLLYGLCIDEGLLTPKTVINDIPVNYNGYAPENYDQRFNGAVAVEYALDHSLNIPAVKSLQLLGKDKLTAVLSDCGFSQIRKDHRKLGLSLILGGCGATLEQLTGLFSAFANDGIYVAPRYSSSDTSSGRTRVLSPEADYMITEILSKVNRPDFPLNWTATEHMPKIAWKTGTSYGRRDAWSIGYNRNYTVGVWVGNFSGTGVAELSGANTATPLLFKIFNTIDYDSNSDWYTPPADCELRQVCSESGLPPGPNCPNLISDYFIPLVSSTQICHHLKELKVSPDSSVSYCESCAPKTGYIKKFYRDLSPEMQDYLQSAGIAYQKIPPHNPQCEKIFRGEGPRITSPLNGNEYYINKKNPEPLQLTASAGTDVSRIYWYIDDRFYKSTKPGEKQFFIPAEGPVQISCTDDKGRNRNIKITVKYVNL